MHISTSTDASDPRPDMAEDQRRRGRKRGGHNADYAQKRQKMAAAMLPVVVGGETVSLQKLAAAAGVSVPTLRHYFDDRDGAIAAAMEVLAQQAAPHVGRLKETAAQTPEATLCMAMTQFVVAWRDFGVGAAIERCLSLGLLEGKHLAQQTPRVGPAVVDFVLEPTIDGLEVLTQRLIDDGHIDADVDVRFAALALLSPVLVALLHQDGLNGVRCRPLDVDTFVASHVKRFLRGYGVVPPR